MSNNQTNKKNFISIFRQALLKADPYLAKNKKEDFVLVLLMTKIIYWFTSPKKIFCM
jgi:hypothetical protein